MAMTSAGEVESYGMLRAADLPGWLRRVGLTDVRRHNTLLEFSAPLSSFVRQQWRTYLTFMAQATGGLAIPAADAAFWTGIRDTDGAEAIMDGPDFSICGGNTLAVGRVPSRSCKM